MPLKKPVLFFLLAIILALEGIAQKEEINFTALTTKDGLSSNTVNAIIKDQHGLMWFGTDDGLAKFDGINFTVYRQRTGDSASLPANEILSLHVDKAGRLWVGTSGGSLAQYDRQKDAFIRYPTGADKNSIGNNVIRSVWSDHAGKLWIAHYSGVNVLDPVTNKITSIDLPFGSSGSAARSSLCLFEDSRNLMWIGTTNGLFSFDPATKTTREFLHSDVEPGSISGNYINVVTEDKAGNIWVGTDNGLNLLKGSQNGFIHYKQTSGGLVSLSSNFINSIAVDGPKLWIGTGEGLDILDTQTGEIEKFHVDFRNNHSLTGKSVRYVYIDRQGIYWLGTTRGGVDKYDRNLTLFNYVKGNVFDDKGLNASIVTAFAETRSGDVYVGTEGKGLSLFNRKTKLFDHLAVHSNSATADQRLLILCLKMTVDEKLLIGTFSDGLLVFDPATAQSRRVPLGAAAGNLNANDIFCMEEDRNRNIWLGTNGGGINILNAEYKVIRRYTPYPKDPNDIKLPINGYIRDIRQDRNNNMWIATHGGGIAFLETSSGKFTIFNTGNSELPNDKVQTLLEDKKGNIWAGTFGGGISIYDKAKKRFINFSEKDGLQNSTIYKLLEDQNGLIWGSTNKGISSIDYATGKIDNYNQHNGVQNNNFVPGSGLRLSNNELFFGGVEGFNYFNPSQLRKNNNVPEILLTELRISNRLVTPSDDGPIKEHISIAKEINLDYKQNFALSFVGLNYTSPEQNQYAYKLEGFDKDWNYVGSAMSAPFTNLDPGEYTFRVRASNNHDVWNSNGISIKVFVHPPFWRTIYAYIFYALLVIGSLFYIRYRGIQKLKKRFALEQEKVQLAQERREAERTHELDRLKIKFLTNLSHEFRTPISLIMGPVDNLIKQATDDRQSNDLGLIKRNARRLLNLVNQLLDFRKMEEQELKLQETEGDLVLFLKEIADAFQDLAQRKRIGFSFESDIANLYTKFDHDKIERIIFNVLSNAFKFTLAEGTIKVVLKQAELLPSVTWVSINVIDSGIGIPVDEKEKIFDRFFQHQTELSVLNQGTGIGLSITREFVKMHGGTISVESEPGKGANFTILLPFVPLQTEIIQSVPASADEEIQVSQQSAIIAPSTSLSDAELPLVLIVEDNDDFRFYLKENLRLKYRIMEAVNGKEGWQRALAHHPQMIVSDISMPYMDGIALLQKIKSDKRTSHIPVILLTALTSQSDQLKGLETGANDYITKPFNAEVLNAKIKNLLELNTRLKSTYSKQIKVVAPEIKIESADELLLHRIATYIEENLTDTQLSVENLSRHVGMSRSSLYSKLLEMTGQTPVEYIRSVKLEKASTLLRNSDLNVAQIAYSVGFSTPNYFAKSFKIKYGMLPSEFISKARNSQKKVTDE